MTVFERLKTRAHGADFRLEFGGVLLDAMLQLELSKELARLQAEVRATMPDNPAACGFKVYSQADEDGILEEIARRIGIAGGHSLRSAAVTVARQLALPVAAGLARHLGRRRCDNIAAIRAALPSTDGCDWSGRPLRSTTSQPSLRRRDRQTSARWTCSRWMSTVTILQSPKRPSCVVTEDCHRRIQRQVPVSAAAGGALRPAASMGA
jgi:hypothetical protein